MSGGANDCWERRLGHAGIALGVLVGLPAAICSSMLLDAILLPLTLSVAVEVHYCVGLYIGAALDRNRRWRRDVSDPRKENP